MSKPQVLLKAPNQLIEIQKIFLGEISLPDQKIVPLQLPFYNFVCQTIDLFTQFVKTTYQITFNLFIIDYHLRKYTHVVELYRRFIGYINTWKKYSDQDQTKLFLTFLNESRNKKKDVRLFLKLRKILLKTINHKILQQINLTHQDAVTIIHTMNIISVDLKRILTRKINQYFITKNLKYVSNAKFNSAIICEYFLTQIRQKVGEVGKFDSNSSCKINSMMKKEVSHIEQFEEEPISVKEISFDHDTFESIAKNNLKSTVEDKENSNSSEQINVHEKSLVSLDQCLRELNILKQRDMQIDNRFRKLNLNRQDLR